MVTDYGIEEYNYYPIKCLWTFVHDNMQSMDIENEAQMAKQKAVLFDHGCSIPNLKSLTFTRTEKIKFQLFYDPAPPGFNPFLGEYLIHQVVPKEKEFGTKLRVKLN